MKYSLLTAVSIALLAASTSPLLALASAAGAAGTSLGGTPDGGQIPGRLCAVPEVHSTIQRAVDDPGCRQVQIMGGRYRETLVIDRSVTIAGASGTVVAIEGRIVVEGSETLVSMVNLTVATSCAEAIATRNGSQVALAAVEVVAASAIPCVGAGSLPMMARLGEDYVVVESDTARDPRVGVDAMGRSTFVYTDTDTDTIYWTVVEAQESVVTPASPLSTTPSVQESSDIGVRPDGSFYAAWRSDEENEEDVDRQIRGRFFSTADGLDAADSLVNDLPDPTTHNGLESGGLAALGGGGFASVWSSRQTHGTPDPGTADDIQGRTINSTGVVSATPQFHVNNLVNSNRQTEADVGPTADGGFLAVWGSYMSDGYQIRGRRYAADGTPDGDEFRIETDTTGGQHEPRVAANGEGELLVVWEHGSTPRTIRGRLFDADVVPIGDDFLISSRTDVKQQFPHVGGGAEHFVVAWEREEDDWDVEARVVTGHDSFDGPAFQVNTYDAPSLRHDEVGVGAFGDRATITWQGTFADGSGIHSIMARTVRLCGLFCDGFESGDTTAWSGTSP